MNIFNLPDLGEGLPDAEIHEWFVKEGLGELLEEVSPIDDYTGTKLSVRFKKYHFEPPKLTESEAR